MLGGCLGFLTSYKGVTSVLRVLLSSFQGGIGGCYTRYTERYPNLTSTWHIEIAFFYFSAMSVLYLCIFLYPSCPCCNIYDPGLFGIHFDSERQIINKYIK